MKILLLSAYHAASHQQWAEQLIAGMAEHDWQLLTLPPRHFSWRIRGNSLYWAYSEIALLTQPYDLVLATSMVDLSALRGLVPALAQIPTVVYFHENQFDYPGSGQERAFSIEPCLVNLYSALCADRIIFNSHYNRDTFLAGVNNLLRKLPDKFPNSIHERLVTNASVLPVPIPADFYLPAENADPKLVFQIVWNHRREYDKGPDRLLRCLQQLPDYLPLRFHILGQSFRNQPQEFSLIKTLLEQNGWLDEWGYVDSKQHYRSLLQRSALVLSTALHDFQGLAVLEAAATGCIPVVPDRLAYPEYIANDCCYHSVIDEPEMEAKAAAEMILRRFKEWESALLESSHSQNKQPQNKQAPAPVSTTLMQDLSWEKLKPGYEKLFTTLTKQ